MHSPTETMRANIDTIREHTQDNHATLEQHNESIVTLQNDYSSLDNSVTTINTVINTLKNDKELETMRNETQKLENTITDLKAQWQKQIITDGQYSHDYTNTKINEVTELLKKIEQKVDNMQVQLNKTATYPSTHDHRDNDSSHKYEEPHHNNSPNIISFKQANANKRLNASNRTHHSSSSSSTSTHENKRAKPNNHNTHRQSSQHDRISVSETTKRRIHNALSGFNTPSGKKQFIINYGSDWQQEQVMEFFNETPTLNPNTGTPKALLRILNADEVSASGVCTWLLRLGVRGADDRELNNDCEKIASQCGKMFQMNIANLQ